MRHKNKPRILSRWIQIVLCFGALILWERCVDCELIVQLKTQLGICWTLWCGLWLFDRNFPWPVQSFLDMDLVRGLFGTTRLLIYFTRCLNPAPTSGMGPTGRKPFLPPVHRSRPMQCVKKKRWKWCETPKESQRTLLRHSLHFWHSRTTIWTFIVMLQ